MNILVYTQRDMNLPLTEGLRQETWLLAQALHKKGHKVSVLHHGKTREHKEIHLKGIARWQLPFYLLTHKERYDILHLMDAPNMLTTLVLNKLKYDKAFMTITDGECNTYWKAKQANKNILTAKRKVQTIFLLTHYQKELTKEHFSNTTILPPLYSELDTSTPPTKTPTPTVLFMSHLSKHKGAQTLLDTIPLVHAQDPTVRFIIADSGHSTEHNSYKKQLQQLRNVELKTTINPTEELRKAWIYLYPVTQAHNTFAVPLSLYEATQQGTPFIYSNVGGIADYVHKDYLVEPNNAEALTKKILEFINTPPQKNTINLHDNNTVVTRILEAYEQ